MSLTPAAILAEAGHVSLPMETWVYGLIAILIFAVLGFVTFSYRDVANRHRGKAEAYAASHGDDGHNGGHGGH